MPISQQLKNYARYRVGYVLNPAKATLNEVLKTRREQKELAEEIKKSIELKINTYLSSPEFVRLIIEKTLEKIEVPKIDEAKIIAEVASKIPTPQDGKDYVLTENDKKQIASKIKVPIVDKIIEKTEIIKEQPIVTEVVKEKAVADTPEQIKEKLKDLAVQEPWFPVKHLLGLEDTIRNFANLFKEKVKFGGGGGGGTVEFFNISGTINGSNTAFTLPKKFTNPVICYNGQVLDPISHYSISGLSLTLNIAPVSGTLFGFGQPA